MTDIWSLDDILVNYRSYSVHHS